MIRAKKSDYNSDWIIEQQFSCINGLTSWFQIATVEEADGISMGYTDGALGTAEDRAKTIVAALTTALQNDLGENNDIRLCKGPGPMSLKLNYELIYKTRAGNFPTDSRRILQIEYENAARAQADKLHDEYLAFLKRELKTDQFEVSDQACMADGILSHVYVGTKIPKGISDRRCCFCGCIDD